MIESESRPGHPYIYMVLMTTPQGIHVYIKLRVEVCSISAFSASKCGALLLKILQVDVAA